MSTGLPWVSIFFLLFIYVLQIFFTVLHPRHKLQYFEKAGWEDAWIKTSREIVRTEFDQTYAFMDVEDEDQSDALPPSVCITYSFIYILLANFFPFSVRLPVTTFSMIFPHFPPLQNQTFVTNSTVI